MTEKQTSGIGKGTPGPGRKKGIPNKANQALREMILAALDNQPGGGVEYLTRQADANPNSFMTLLGKVLPTTLAGDPNSPVQHRILVEFVGKAS
jgi:hypothetical protein